MAYTDINDPTAYFQTKLYTGGTAEAKTFDGNSNLKPDWFWSKKRGAVQSHQTADSVRGISNALRIDTTIAEYSNTETDDLASFDTNGFTFSGTGDTYNGTYQSSSYVAWCWSAGGGTTASNTDGSITSTVSANTTSGFSIVSWTGNGSNGATIGHGLGVTPAIVITKRRSAVGDWLVGGSLIDTVRGGANSLLLLNGTNAMDSNSEVYQTFSSTTFQVGTNEYANTSGSTMISYCFAEKKGFSKFGSYTGNGSTDGTFVYTGFKPAWVMIKRTDAAGFGWSMFDNKRDPDNVVEGVFNADTTAAEDTASDWLDFTSNGFKVRFTGGDINANGGSYIYMAFAENPLVTSGGTPTTAR